MGTISVRVDDDVKNNVEKIFKKMGLTVSSATNVFYHQVLQRGEIPFRIISADDEYIKTLMNGISTPESELVEENDLKW
ncbi:MAG: type II toxin-antitoxin system RelB/DinJ family antitoxin [Candidatus Ancillula sp.]|jgi:addiction module RelB/DinJ family antitoxin|nr:type II toxin-antitoxin system RelB/DinJ family antitoxin [Candidatus Ancillula sp.]